MAGLKVSSGLCFKSDENVKHTRINNFSFRGFLVWFISSNLLAFLSGIKLMAHFIPPKHTRIFQSIFLIFILHHFEILLEIISYL